MAELSTTEANVHIKKSSVPSELKISAQWDSCIERTVINFGAGLVVGALSAVVLTTNQMLERLQHSHTAAVNCNRLSSNITMITATMQHTQYA
eukprot:10937-Heterococcus_DN1.PRE.2